MAILGTCYTLEGDSVMILRGSVVFEIVEATIGTKFPFGKVHNVVDKVLDLILQNKALTSQKKRLADKISC